MHTLSKKTLANRLNAKKSTGPKTVLGKRRSSLNSITHGLTCEKNVSIGENKKEFEELKKNYKNKLKINKKLGKDVITLYK